jgi:hypothetical protein
LLGTRFFPILAFTNFFREPLVMLFDGNAQRMKKRRYGLVLGIAKGQTGR